MQKELELVAQFHRKFSAPILNSPALIPADRSDLRHRLMAEEVEEYLQGVRDQDLPNIAKEMCDILFAVYGTILEHGLQDIIEDAFEEVHRSNMSKSIHRYKMVKGESYAPPDMDKYFP